MRKPLIGRRHSRHNKVSLQGGKGLVSQLQIAYKSVIFTHLAGEGAVEPEGCGSPSPGIRIQQDGREGFLDLGLKLNGVHNLQDSQNNQHQTDHRRDPAGAVPFGGRLFRVYGTLLSAGCAGDP